MSLKIAVRIDACFFKVAILFFYESAVGAKGLENDRDCSWLLNWLNESFRVEQEWIRIKQIDFDTNWSKIHIAGRVFKRLTLR